MENSLNVIYDFGKVVLEKLLDNIPVLSYPELFHKSYQMPTAFRLFEFGSSISFIEKIIPNIGLVVIAF